MNTYQLVEKKISGRYVIRPFTENDVEQVAELFVHHFSENIRPDIQVIKEKLLTGLSNPNRSLVCSSQDDTVQGYITVKMADFLFKGRPVKGAICSDFMVNEEARSALIPMRMLQRVLLGPQDFSFTEDAAQASRMMWCRLGGQIAHPYSSYYTILLRPVSSALQLVTKNLPQWVKKPAGAVGRGADTILESLRLPFYKTCDVDIPVVEPEGKHLEEKLTLLMNNYELRPSVDKKSLNKFIKGLKQEKHFGNLHTGMLSDPDGEITGWFIYYLNHTRRCNVIHAECTPGNEEKLYVSLKNHTFRKGGVNISGRLSPSQIGSSFSEKTISRPGGKWSLVHSKNNELLNTVQSGKAFLTRCW